MEAVTMQPKLRIEISMPVLILAIVIGLSLVGGERRAEADERRPLAGLFGIKVVVEELNSDAERDGMTTAALQTNVEFRLRQAGIRVLTRVERYRTPGEPYLYLRFTSLNDRGLYAYCVNLQLKEIVRLDRNPSVTTSAETWHATGAVVTVGARNLHTSFQRSVREVTDQFINAYLAANPKR